MRPDRFPVDRIGLRHGTYLRGYVYEFIRLFALHLSREVVDATMRGGAVNFELPVRFWLDFYQRVRPRLDG